MNLFMGSNMTLSCVLFGLLQIPIKDPRLLEMHFSDAFEVLSTTPIDKTNEHFAFSECRTSVISKVDGWIDQWVRQHNSTRPP